MELTMSVKQIGVLLACIMCFGGVGVCQSSCTCYLNSDCKGRNSFCDSFGGCLPQGKKDGKCNTPASPPSAVSVDVSVIKNGELAVTDKLAMSSAIDAYFRSFIKAVE